MIRPGQMLSEVLKNGLRKPATVLYPFTKVEMPPNFRGRIQFFAERCIGCKLCMKDCPAEAITISEVSKKRFDCTIDLARCIYCAQCTYSCNKDALQSTRDFELAGFVHAKLVAYYEAPPEGDAASEPPTAP
jgi:formate hydrogenlyase subunit 6/NADH:ubiquinone oxidoreductase subunit I